MVNEFKIGGYYLCINDTKRQTSFSAGWFMTDYKFTKGFYYSCDEIGIIDDWGNYVSFRDVNEINAIKPCFEEINFKVDDEIISKIKEKKNRINSPIHDIQIRPLLYNNVITIYRCHIFFNRSVCGRFSINSVGPSQIEAYQNAMREYKMIVGKGGDLKLSLIGEYHRKRWYS